MSRHTIGDRVEVLWDGVGFAATVIRVHVAEEACDAVYEIDNSVGKFLCVEEHGLKLMREKKEAGSDAGTNEGGNEHLKVLRKPCSVQACGTKAVARGVCFKHGATGHCSVTGCTTNSQARGVCIKHGAKGNCSTHGCTSNAHTRGFCIKHRAKTHCSVDECTSPANGRGVCTRHGVRGACTVLGCTTKALSRGLCFKHGAKGPCSARGCTSNARTRGGVCYYHDDDAVCSMEACTAQARGNGTCSRHSGEIPEEGERKKLKIVRTASPADISSPADSGTNSPTQTTPPNATTDGADELLAAAVSAETTSGRDSGEQIIQPIYGPAGELLGHAPVVDRKGTSTPVASRQGEACASKVSPPSPQHALDMVSVPTTSSKSVKKATTKGLNPKRPKTAYTCFVSALRPSLMKKHPTESFKSMAKMIGKMWREMPEDERVKYQLLAEVDKERFRREKCAQQQNEVFDTPHTRPTNGTLQSSTPPRRPGGYVETISEPGTRPKKKKVQSSPRPSRPGVLVETMSDTDVEFEQRSMPPPSPDEFEEQSSMPPGEYVETITEADEEYELQRLMMECPFEGGFDGFRFAEWTLELGTKNRNILVALRKISHEDKNALMLETVLYKRRRLTQQYKVKHGHQERKEPTELKNPYIKHGYQKRRDPEDLEDTLILS